MKNFDFLYNTVICSYLLMKKLLTVLLALRHFSWLVSLTPLQASTWLPRMAGWLKNGCRGCFVGACDPASKPPPPRGHHSHRLPGLRLHSVLAVASLLAHDNTIISYYVQVGSWWLGSGVASDWASLRLWGAICFAVDGAIDVCI